MSREPRNYHEDADLFREALSYTQSETGFGTRMVEKDYYCSLVLEDLLAIANPQWVFKGGTCLSKVHSDFYRMSEDLDFAFSVPVDISRHQRSKMIGPMKEHLAKLAGRLACFKVIETLRGFNNSMQYIGGLSYNSVVTGQGESIKVEFSIREPILEPVEYLPARALLVDPFRQAAAVAPVKVPVLSCRETYAEKLRAALTRREPAIRDFYDIDHGVRAERLTMGDRRLIELVRGKLAVPGNDPIDASARKYETLTRQILAQLKPVLRESDFAAFDLKRAFGIVAHIAAALR
ncbi:MAG: nucleotidyl transferase AbiEii/AbiGii toxin family protein [Planctomycetota bacterium]